MLTPAVRHLVVCRRAKEHVDVRPEQLQCVYLPVIACFSRFAGRDRLVGSCVSAHDRERVGEVALERRSRRARAKR